MFIISNSPHKVASCVRALAHYTLGRVYAAGGESEKARASWAEAVSASPHSRDGQAAQRELEKLAAPVVASDVAGRRMPDRFPKISLETTPIVVFATVTFPNHRGDWERKSLPESIKMFLTKLEKQPGLFGVHALSSKDNRGMLVILTWWENKKALNDWFYSETHRHHQPVLRKRSNGFGPGRLDDTRRRNGTGWH